MAVTQVRRQQIADELTAGDFAAASVDGVAGTASMRTLGTGAQQAAAGNHTHTALATLAVSDLAAGRVVTVGTAGELQDDAALTFSGGVLGATSVVASSVMVAGAVIAVGTNYALSGAARLAKDSWIAARNRDNSADLNMWRVNTSGAAVDFLEPGSPIFRDDFGLFDDHKSWLTLRRNYTAVPTAGTRDSCAYLAFQTKQSGTVSEGRVGLSILAEDAGVTAKAVTGMSRVGTTVTVTAAAHGYANGDKLTIYNVTHTFNINVNNAWIISNVTTNTFDIAVAGLSSGAYTSGGTATNRGLFYGVLVAVAPLVDRDTFVNSANQFGDDVGGYVLYNNGPGKGTDGIYVGHNQTSFPGTSEWITTIDSDANADYGVRMNGRYVGCAFDASSATFASNPAAYRMGNAHWLVGRNAANSADLNMWRVNGANYLDFGTKIFKDDKGVYSPLANYDAYQAIFRVYTAVPDVTRSAVVCTQLQTKQATGLYNGRVANYVLAGDDATVLRTLVTGATNATPIVVTTPAAHGLADGDLVTIWGVAGNTAANGTYYVKVTTVGSSTTFGLYTNAALTAGVAGNGTYQANTGQVTNCSSFYCTASSVYPTVGRGGLLGLDDVDCFVGYNGGSVGAKGTDCFYVGRNNVSFPSDSEWICCFTFDANADFGVRLNGTYTAGALDCKDGSFPLSTSFYLRTPRDFLGPTGLGIGLSPLAPALGLHQLGGSSRLQALGTPAAPTTAVGGGTPAGASSFYFVVAEDRAGFRTLTSAASTSAAAGSSTVNWRKVTWAAVGGAVKYYVLRNTSSTPANTTLLLNTGTWTGGGITAVTVTAGGSGYTSAPTVSFYGGQGGTAAVATLSGSTVGSIAVTSGGSQYTSVPTVVVTPSNGVGSGATATAALGIYGPTVAAGGSGYALDDTLTISGGTNSITARCRVVAVSGGAVTAVEVYVTGAYSVLPANNVATTTGGAGSGCTLTLLWKVSAIAVTAAGTGYTAAPTVSFSGGGGSPAAVANTAANAVTNVVVTAPGSGQMLDVIPGKANPLSPTVVFSGGAGSGAAATCSISTLEADDSGQAATGAFTLPARNTTADTTIDGSLTLGTTVLATATAGTLEYDGKAFYASPAASGRAVLTAEQFVCATADFTLSAASGAQNLFTTANDVLTVAASTTYEFEAVYYLTTGATTHTTATLFGGTATYTSVMYTAELWSGTAGTISTTAPSFLVVTAATSTVLNATSTATMTVVRLRGTIRVNAAGTLVPQVNFSANPTGTNLTKTNSYFRLWPVGTDTVAAVGNWG